MIVIAHVSTVVYNIRLHAIINRIIFHVLRLLRYIYLFNSPPHRVTTVLFGVYLLSNSHVLSALNRIRIVYNCDTNSDR